MEGNKIRGRIHFTPIMKSWGSAIRGPLRRRQGPTYPLIRTNVLNYSMVYIRFTLQEPCGGGLRRTAWLTQGMIGQPVKIKLDRNLPCEQPTIKSQIQTSTAQLGAPIATGMPCTFSVRMETGITMDFGCTVDSNARWLYVPSGQCASPTPTTINPIFQTTNLGSSHLITGIGNKVTSFGTGEQSLRALPTAVEGEYDLAWRAVASPDGIPISLVTFCYGEPCTPCPLLTDPLRYC